jgi:hypothetical protein
MLARSTLGYQSKKANEKIGSFAGAQLCLVYGCEEGDVMPEQYARHLLDAFSGYLGPER